MVGMCWCTCSDDVCRFNKERRARELPLDYEKRTPGKRPLANGTHKGRWAVHIYDRAGKKLRTEYYKDEDGAMTSELLASQDA